jgi:uncharacterized protein (TIGR03437 family)
MSLAGTGVTFDGIPAPLLLVSPDQINAQIPFEVVLSSFRPTSSMVIVSTAAGSSPPVPVSTFATGPGIFTQDASGCGAAAALNVTSDGAVSLNSTSQSAAPGDYIALFGTGLGSSSNLPPDGHAAVGANSFTESDLIFLDRSSVITSLYAGVAPLLVGVDQVNFQIPSDAPQGCHIPLTVDAGDVLSPRVTISINSSRGQCVDPPVESFGEVSIESIVATGTSNDGESDTFKALFPAAPGLKPPLLVSLVPGTTENIEPPAPNARVCPIPGEVSISVGAITMQGPAGVNAVAQPLADPSSGVSASSGAEYDLTLPNGFVQPGQYSVAATGPPVWLQGAMTVGSPITIVTDLAPGAALSASTDRTIAWTGGDASELVRVTIIADATEVLSARRVYYALGSDGLVNLGVGCVPYNNGSSLLCDYGLPLSGTAEVRVDVLPATGWAESVATGNTTYPVLLTWAYHYVFGGLSITD